MTGRMRAILLPVALFLLWFPLCGHSEEEPLDVEEILSAEPAEEDYVKAVRCLPARRIRSITALDDRHIVFRVSRTERYLVQLQRRCPGIRKNDAIVYESTSGVSVCRHDSIRGMFGIGPGNRQLGPRCAITEFQQITPEQLELVRESLKQAKQR